MKKQVGKPGGGDPDSTIKKRIRNPKKSKEQLYDWNDITPAGALVKDFYWTPVKL